MLLLAVSTGACAPESARQDVVAVAPVAEQAQGDVLSVINGSPEYSLFATMLQRSDLARMLSSKGPFTVFVPTDAAFSGMPPGTLDELLRPQNKRALAALVMDHIVPGKFSSADWKATPYLGAALGGQPLTYGVGQYEQINNAPLVRTDIPAANGVVHVVNAPLSLPPLP